MPSQSPKARKQFTEEARKAVHAQGKYAKVYPDMTYTVASLGGAMSAFKKDPNHVYVSELGVSGPKKVVTSALDKLGYDGKDYVAGGFTVASVKAEHEAKFKSQLAAGKAGGRGRKVSSTNFVFEDIKRLAAHLSTAVEVEQPVVKKAGTRSRSSSPRGRAVDIRAKLTHAKNNNQVLDVSNMKANGAGTKSMDAPGEKSSRVHVPGVDVVSSNLKNFETALRLLEVDEQSYNNAVDGFKELHSKVKRRATATKRRTTTAKKPAAKKPAAKKTAKKTTPKKTTPKKTTKPRSKPSSKTGSPRRGSTPTSSTNSVGPARVTPRRSAPPTMRGLNVGAVGSPR